MLVRNRLFIVKKKETSKFENISYKLLLVSLGTRIVQLWWNDPFPVNKVPMQAPVPSPLPYSTFLEPFATHASISLTPKTKFGYYGNLKRHES